MEIKLEKINSFGFNVQLAGIPAAQAAMSTPVIYRKPDITTDIHSGTARVGVSLQSYLKDPKQTLPGGRPVGILDYQIEFEAEYRVTGLTSALATEADIAAHPAEATELYSQAWNDMRRALENLLGDNPNLRQYIPAFNNTMFEDFFEANRPPKL